MDLVITGGKLGSSAPVEGSSLKKMEYVRRSTFGFREQSFSERRRGSMGKTWCVKYVEVPLF
jgi:hypothetical protein